jgi:branched-subunit amino acid aminotransferase/4-amino-4-deoxychorismate lyase
MTGTALSSSHSQEGVVVEGTMTVPADDPLARHKTLNYWRKALGYASAQAHQAHDLICVTPEGWLCESSRYNLFLVSSGRVYTPSTDLPLLSGVMRGVVLEQVVKLGITVVEAHLPLTFVNEATEAFLTNSVRGIVPISRLLGKELAAPGGVTEALSRAVGRWLDAGGDHP